MMSVLEALAPRIGEELAVSDWLAINQERIDRFAACTEDFQWIHVDQARAKEGPFGGTIAHGFLTLSLLPRLTGDAWRQGTGITTALNYGLERVRFLTPVRAGARVRNRMRLLSVEAKPAGVLIGFENTVDIEGEAKPALVAHTLAMAVG